MINGLFQQQQQQKSDSLMRLTSADWNSLNVERESIDRFILSLFIHMQFTLENTLRINMRRRIHSGDDYGRALSKQV